MNNRNMDNASENTVYLYHKEVTEQPKRTDFYHAGKAILSNLSLAPQLPVVLKPNVVWRTEAESGIVTHPAFMAGLVDALLSKDVPASEIIVAEGGGVHEDHDMAAFYELAGYTAELAPRGIELRDLNLDNSVERLLPEGRVLKAVHLARTVVEAGTLINVAKMKTHNLAVVTLCTKNLQGMLAPLCHRHLCTAYPRHPNDNGIGLAHHVVDKPSRFFQKQVDLYTAIKPDLHIVEGIVGRDGTGFNRGNNIPMGLALAGYDALAVDHVGAELMGFAAEEVGCLDAATVRGLYHLDPSRLHVLYLREEKWRSCPDWRRYRAQPAFELLRREDIVYDEEP